MALFNSDDEFSNGDKKHTFKVFSQQNLDH